MPWKELQERLGIDQLCADTLPHSCNFAEPRSGRLIELRLRSTTSIFHLPPPTLDRLPLL
jgi:hypothetical protein